MNDDKKWEYGFRLDVLRALCCSRDCTEELKALLDQFNVDAEKSELETAILESNAFKDAKHEARAWGAIDVLRIYDMASKEFNPIQQIGDFDRRFRFLWNDFKNSQEKSNRSKSL